MKKEAYGCQIGCVHLKRNVPNVFQCIHFNNLYNFFFFHYKEPFAQWKGSIDVLGS